MKKKIFIYTVIMIFTAGVASGAPANQPKTGQQTSYASGDDGDKKAGVAWPGTRFTTNADTTVTDSLTGLVWAPNGNIMPMRDSNWDQDGAANDGQVTWQHALDYVAKLNAESYLGHNDWRLPNVNDLESLVHGGYKEETCSGSQCANNAAWLNTKGFNVQAEYYWSSTTYAGDPSCAWSVDMYYGNVFTGYKFSVHSVWPVRGGQ